MLQLYFESIKTQGVFFVTNSKGRKGQVGRFAAMVLAFLMALSSVPVVQAADTYPEIEPFSAGFSASLVTVSAGLNHTAAICTNGFLWTWGSNANGQLGHGHTNTVNVPTQVGDLGGWTAVSAGSDHTVGIRNGNLYAWGHQGNGRLGNGVASATIRVLEPARTAMQDDHTGFTWTYVTAGASQTMAIRSDGSLWGFGNAQAGRLGIATTGGTNSNPIRVGTDTNWSSVSTGNNHTLGIRTDGSLWAWGNNTNGRLGDGTTTQRNAPVRIGTETNWQSVSASNATVTTNSFSVGIRAGGLYTWGSSANGQLGNNLSATGAAGNVTAPARRGTYSDWVSVSAGANHGAGVRGTGASATLWTWGQNTNGQLGTGDNSGRLVPTQVGEQGGWQAVSAGNYHTAAIGVVGSLWTWGCNENSFLGSGGIADSDVPLFIWGGAIAVSGGNTVAAGESVQLRAFAPTMANLEVSTVGWSSSSASTARANAAGLVTANPFGLGLVTITATNRHGGAVATHNITVGAAPAPPNTISQVSAGRGYVMALTTGGNLRAWGYNDTAQLGTGNVNATNRIVDVYHTSASHENTWIAVASSRNHATTTPTHTIAIAADGSLWAWGNNANGRTGMGTTAGHTLIPTRIALDPIHAGYTWQSVAAGYNFSLAVRCDGTLWGWGNQGNSRLGAGGSSPANVLLPTRSGTDSNWKMVTAGNNYGIGIRTDGSMYAWGAPQNGRLGNGSTSGNVQEPVRIATQAVHADYYWLHVSSGLAHSVAIRSDNTLWAWGHNTNGRVGTGTAATQYTTPVRIAADHTYGWKYAFAGHSHTLALREDGTLWAWGLGTGGRLGDGATENRNAPTRICTCGVRNCDINACPDNEWAAISAGFDHSVALKSDGTVWTWGINNRGQLGRGSISDSSRPVLIWSEDIELTAPQGTYIHNPGRRLSLQALGHGSLGEIGNRRSHEKASVAWHSSNPAVALVNVNGVVRARSQGTARITATAINSGDPASRYTNYIDITVGYGPPIMDPSISAGNRFALYIADDGRLNTWGINLLGQLGDSSRVNSTNALRPVGNDVWDMISAGTSHSLAIHEDGSLWAWGNQLDGRLGNGAISGSIYTPVRVATQTQHMGYTWNYVSAGFDFSFAIRNDGTLWAWGRGNGNRLGVGDTRRRDIPYQVGTDSSWESVSAGNAHTLAIRTDGSLWAWGSGTNGRLGQGSQSNISTPTQIGTASDWISVSAGNTHSVGIRGDRSNIEEGGTLWAWGANANGRLGNGLTTGNTTSPVQIIAEGVPASGWAQASAGHFHTLAVRAMPEATMWAWGLGTNGRIGDGETIQRTTPVEIGTSPDWVEQWISVSAGTDHSTALSLHTDGNGDEEWVVWHWGVYSNVPVEVGQMPVREIMNVVTSVPVDTNRQLTGTAMPLDATSREISWELVNPGEADVTITTSVEAGETVYTFHAERRGDVSFTVYVRATIANGIRRGIPFTEVFPITVTPYAVCGESITIEPSPLAIMIYETYLLRATVMPVDATNQVIEWSSADTTVAYVDSETGFVTPAGGGETTITARLECACYGAICHGYIEQPVIVTVLVPPPAEPILRYLYVESFLENGEEWQAAVQQITAPGTTHDFRIVRPYAVHSVDVMPEALVPDETAIDIFGNLSLSVGENEFLIVVATENFEPVEYRLIVYREPPSPHTLALLSVSPGMLVPGFNEHVRNYRVAVANAVGTVFITTIPRDPGITVRIDGAIATPGIAVSRAVQYGAGNPNVVEIGLYLGTTRVNTYWVYVHRAPYCADVSLHSLSVRDEDGVPFAMSPPFIQGVFNDTHMVTVPSAVDSVEILATVSGYASISGDGWVDLELGRNEKTLTVTAESGHEQVYTIIIYRADSTPFLSRLEVTPGTLNPVFQPATTDYRVYLAYDVSQITLTAVPDCPDAEIFGFAGTPVDGNGVTATVPVPPGRTTIRLTVVAESGAYLVYAVTLIRPIAGQCGDTSLRYLSVAPWTLEPLFYTGIRYYYVEDVIGDTILVYARQTSDYADLIADTGNMTLDPGRNEIVITVRAQNGDIGRHVIIVYRIVSPYETDATLQYLSVNPGDLDPAFAPAEQVYDVILDGEDSIEITAIPNCDYAIIQSVSGTPNSPANGDTFTRSLDRGMNTIEIVVAAEDRNFTMTYTLRILNCDGCCVPGSSCALLYDIELSYGSLDPVFYSETFNYTVDVYGISEITVTATTLCPDATVIEGNTMHSLDVGENTILIRVQAQNGNVQVYTIIVTLLPPTPLLSSLTVTPYIGTAPQAEITLLPMANPVREFTLNVEYEENFAYIRAIPTVGIAEVTAGTGRHPLNIGENNFTVAVAPAHGSPVVYHITIIRDTPLPADYTLIYLSVTPGMLRPAFNRFEFGGYSVAVAADATHVLVVARPFDPDLIRMEWGSASHEGDGVHALVPGPNTIEIHLYRISSDTRVNTYTVVVHRAPPCADVGLRTLRVVGEDGEVFYLLPPFVPGIFTDTHTAFVPHEAETVTIEVEVCDCGSPCTTVAGADDVNPAPGRNEFAVTVTAQNGDSQVYTIIIYRGGSPLLSYLSVDVGDLDPAFSPAIIYYDVDDVDYAIDEITITAIAQCNDATVLGDGTQPLAVGVNVLRVTVVSSDGRPVTYTITITRGTPPPELCSDTSLSELSVNPGALVPAFAPAIRNFEVTMAYYVDEIYVDATENSDYAVILSGLGYIQLLPGQNVLEILVLAENGDVGTHEIVVMRPLLRGLVVTTYADSAQDNEYVLVYEGERVGEFTIGVAYYVNAAVISATPSAANVSIGGEHGSQTLGFGENRFGVVITPAGGESVVYSIIINRATRFCPEDTLAQLDVSPGNLRPAFDPQETSYSVAVPEGVDYVYVTAIPTSPDVTVYGGETQRHDLAPGPNTIEIHLYYDGERINTYTIIVHRAPPCMDVLLRSLEVRDADGNYWPLSPPFDPFTTSYAVSVPDIETVEIFAVGCQCGTECPVVTGTGTVSLIRGDGNPFAVVVTTICGTYEEVYTITINRAGDDSNNAFLRNLSVTPGNLDPVFSPRTDTNFEIRFRYDEATSIEIEAAPDCERATIRGDYFGTFPVDPGETTFVIDVIAEDGTLRTYTITVFRLHYGYPCGDTSLRELDVTPGSLYLPFDPAVDRRSFEVAVLHDVTSIDVTATATSAHAVIESGTGSSPLIFGWNLITVVVRAQDGSIGRHEIRVYRPATPVCIDAYLSFLSLTSNGTETGVLDPAFYYYTFLYEIRVRDAQTITITATPRAPEAIIITGTGTHEIQEGWTTFTVVVAAEARNVRRSYTIRVLNCNGCCDEDPPPDGARLDDIILSHGVLFPEFDGDLFMSYTVEVSGITQIHVTPVRRCPNATVYVDGVAVSAGQGRYISLTPGWNRIAIRVRADDDAVLYYFVNVRLGDGGGLNELAVTPYVGNDPLPQIQLMPPGSPTREFIVRVDISATHVYIHAATGSTVGITGDTGRQELTGERSVFTVTVPHSTPHDYRIIVYRTETPEPCDDTRLGTLVVSGADSHEYVSLAHPFAPGTFPLAITVRYDTEAVTIAATPYSGDATVNVTGLTPINPGQSITVQIVVTAQNGETETHMVEIFRPAGPIVCCGSPFLYSLDVTPGTLVPGFDPLTQAYTVTVAYAVTSITISAEAVCDEATVTGAGTFQLDVGSGNVFTVTVISECGTTRSHTITVTRLPEEETAALGELTVHLRKAGEPYRQENLIPPGNAQRVFEFNVDSDVDSIFITATAAFGSTIGASSDIGEHPLAYGVNTFTVIVNDVYGSVTYTIIVTRDYEDEVEAYLTELRVVDGANTHTLIPPRSGRFFTMEVPEATTSVEIFATASTNATAAGYGIVDLPNEHNEFTITVTPENGETITYTIVIWRRDEVDINNTLRFLYVRYDGLLVELTPAFDPLVTGYSITLLDDATAVNLELLPYDYQNVTTTVQTGSHTLGADPYTIVIGLYRGSMPVNTYTIFVNRTDICDDAYLRSLNVSSADVADFTLSPLFERRAHLEYTVLNVEYGTESVTIVTTAAPRSTIVGDGVVTLRAYPEYYTVAQLTVTAEAGNTRTYTIRIYHPRGCSNPFLYNIIVSEGRLMPEFERGTTNYRVYVAYGTTTIDITAITESEYANAVVTGPDVLVVGENVFTITVTPEVGPARVYTVVVERLGEDGLLLWLDVQPGGIAFSPRTFVYFVDVPHYVEYVYVYYLLAPGALINFPTLGSRTTSNNRRRAYLIDWPTTLTQIPMTVMGIVDSQLAYLSYNINVIRRRSSDATLSNITVSPGTLDFVPGATTQTAVLDGVEPSIIIAVELNCENASVLSGAGERSLNPGWNYLDVIIEAQDGTRRTYTIRVYNGIITPPLCDDARLGSLAANGWTLTPAFEFPSATRTYTVEVWSVDRIFVEALTYSPHATVISGGGIQLITLDRTVIEILVNAQDGTPREYTLIVYLLPEPPEFEITVIGGTASHTQATAGTVITLTAGNPPTDRHAFGGWISDDVDEIINPDSTNNATFTMPARDVTVSVHWDEIPDGYYTIDVVNGGPGYTVYPARFVRPGTLVTVTAGERFGYDFNYWTIEAGRISGLSAFGWDSTTPSALSMVVPFTPIATDYSFYMPENHVTATGHWTAWPIITFDASPGSFRNPDDATLPVRPGTTLEVSDLPMAPAMYAPPNHRFMGWEDADGNRIGDFISVGERRELTVTADTTLTAIWAEIPSYPTRPNGICFAVGDVNFSGTVTSADATMLARYLSGQFDHYDRTDHANFPICLFAADVNGDGFVDIDDLILLAQWLVGHNVIARIAFYNCTCP